MMSGRCAFPDTPISSFGAYLSSFFLSWDGMAWRLRDLQYMPYNPLSWNSKACQVASRGFLLLRDEASSTQYGKTKRSPKLHE